jgi:hypothetical protein
MTAPVYVFICTRTTYDIVVPNTDRDVIKFMRRVHNAFSALVGGFLQAGDLRIRATSDAISNHLLCDGSVLEIASFPQLGALLGSTFGGDGVTTFGLPDYHNDVLAVPPVSVTQVVTPGGTVTTGGEVTTPTEPGQSGASTGGNVVSGGRPQTLGENEDLF